MRHGTVDYVRLVLSVTDNGGLQPGLGIATDSWDESGKMSVKRYRPSCDNSDRHGLVVSGGLGCNSTDISVPKLVPSHVWNF